MFLKNTSDRVVVVINTIVGKIGVKPQEIININHKVLPPISSYIKQVTEDEYLLFRQGTTKVEEQDKEQVEPNEGTDGSESTVLDENVNTIIPNANIEDVQNIAEEVSKGLADNDVMDFVKNLLGNKDNDKFEEKGTNPDSNPLGVQITDSSDEIKELEKQIEELQQTWKEAKTPRKRDKTSKQIKEVQKQLDKLKKDISKDNEE